MKNSLLSIGAAGIVVSCLGGAMPALAGASEYSILDSAGAAGQADFRLADYLSREPEVRAMSSPAGELIRLFGGRLAEGRTPAESADAVVSDIAHLWNLDPGDFARSGPSDDRRPEQGLMYDSKTDSYRFTAVYFTPTIAGVPVYDAGLSVLVRNEDDHPAVLVSSWIPYISEIENWDGGPTGRADETMALRAARIMLGEQAELGLPIRHVVFAGVEDDPAPASLAIEFTAKLGNPAEASDYRRSQFVVDAMTGEVIHERNLVINNLREDGVSGNVGGIATESSGADECEPESLAGMPYARVSSTEDAVFADANGDYFLPVTTWPIEMKSWIQGQWFKVYNEGGADAVLVVTVDEGGVVDFVHNEPDTDPLYRAEVNAYIEANRVRDFVLGVNPTYPTIETQEKFTINVNIEDSCNAFYDGTSINFFRALGDCNNTAFSVIVHHEYGHHVVNVGGSGQAEYGEGMGDIMGVLITGDPEMGRGFHLGECDEGIRTADNNCVLTSNCSSCGTEIHACGQLISGAVWDTWLALQSMLGEPEAFEVISNLTINSVLLHTGGSIGPDIAVDFLTLDDDDGEIGNGTPHYDAIEEGFELHEIEVPDLVYLKFEYPDGVPDVIDPDGTTSLLVLISDLIEELVPGTVDLNIDDGTGWAAYPMTEGEPDEYTINFPDMACPTPIGWYISAQTTIGSTITSPSDGAAEPFAATVAEDVVVAFDDDFEKDEGWQVSGDATTGEWERAVPFDFGPFFWPHWDADGSGHCYLTQLWDWDGSDVNGTTILTSPVLDASLGGSMSFSYWLMDYFENPAGPEDGMKVEVSTDPAGADWTEVRLYDSYVGAWREDSLVIAPDGDVEPTETLRIRFVAFDLPPDNLVEAAVDAVSLVAVLCEDPCPPDIVDSGVVDVDDLLLLLAYWGPCNDCPADFDGDSEVDVDDLLLLLAYWGPCPDA